MKRHVVVSVVFLFLLLAAIPVVTTKVEERRLRDPKRIVSEIGYPIPKDARVIDTSASIWSLADGANYSWTISSPKSLLPWIESLGRLEYGRTYKVVSTLADGREETSYITIAPDELSATLDTFRP